MPELRPTSDEQRHVARGFIVAWVCSLAFYFLEYAARSAPAVMLPELAAAFRTSSLGVSAILGTYYYTYSTTSLVAGALLDRMGAKFVVPTGMAILGLGCFLFAMPDATTGEIGRLLQGAGSAFAFTGAVYLASHGFAAQRLATAIGVTQCLGMLGGSAGQLVSGSVIHGLMSLSAFWGLIGILVVATGVALLWVTPREPHAQPASTSAPRSFLQPYKIVLKNPQSYLCGAIAGLLFVPTTVGDMVWGVRLFQGDRLFSYQSAVFAVAMVPMGWVVGCPLLGWIADKLGRRKPALIGGILVMIACGLQLGLAPDLVPAWLTLFLFGVASGAAMIPYTIIKEANPDEVKGSATGAINFLTFGVTALVGPVFAGRFGGALEAGIGDPGAHFRNAAFFWIGVLVCALALSVVVKETGHRRTA